MAVDAALEQLRQHGLQMALVNADGDLEVLGVPALERQWPIEVEGKTRSWVIPLKRGALATSGISGQHWRQGGHERHHLLDPRTGLPAQSGLWSVTVAADSCEQAEVAAKVAFLLGEAQGGEFLRCHDLSGLLVRVRSWSMKRLNGAKASTSANAAITTIVRPHRYSNRVSVDHNCHSCHPHLICSLPSRQATVMSL